MDSVSILCRAQAWITGSISASHLVVYIHFNRVDGSDSNCAMLRGWERVWGQMRGFLPRAA